MCLVSSVACSRLGLLLGLSSLALCGLSLLSGSWVLTREPLRLHDGGQAGQGSDHVAAYVLARVGLFRTCLRVERVNATTPHIMSPACVFPPYSLSRELHTSDLGFKGHLENTPVVISRVRVMGVMGAIALVLLLAGLLMGLVGHCKADYKSATILCIYMFAIAGLIQCMAIITVPMMIENAPRSGRPPRAEGDSFSWECGWSHLVATLSFIVAHLSAFMMLTAFVKRYPSMEAMVRDIVPGAARKLQEHQESNLVGMWEIYPSRAVRQLGCMGLPAAGCYGKPPDPGAPGASKTKPDICSSNPESSVDSLQQPESSDAQDEQMRSMSPYDPSGSRSVSLGQPMSLASAPQSAPLSSSAPQPAQALPQALPQAPADNTSLAGVSVPITVMRTRPLGHAAHRSIPCNALEGTAGLDPPSFAYGAQEAAPQALPQTLPQDLVAGAGGAGGAGTMTLQPRRKPGAGPLTAPVSGAGPGVFNTLDNRGAPRCNNARAHALTHTLPHPPRQF